MTNTGSLSKQSLFTNCDPMGPQGGGSISNLMGMQQYEFSDALSNGESTKKPKLDEGHFLGGNNAANASGKW